MYLYTEGNWIVVAVVIQNTGFQDEGLKVRTRPPICGPKSVKTQRAWLSAHGEDWTVIHKAQVNMGKKSSIAQIFSVKSIKLHWHHFETNVHEWILHDFLHFLHGFAHVCHRCGVISIFSIQNPFVCLVRCLSWASCQRVWAPYDFISITPNFYTSTHRLLWLLFFLIHILSGYHI